MKNDMTRVDNAPKNNPHMMSRRNFLAGLAVLAGGGAAAMLIGPLEQVHTAAALAGDPLPIPPLLPPQDQNGTKVFNLNLQQGQSHFLAGLTTATLGINGNYLGPTLRASRGDAILMNITNQIGEATTLHWHGMHVPAAMDGGPYQVIANNGQWNPHFTVMQPAATLWYHPHMMGKTREQVLRGMVGLFILDDNNPAGEALPHNYGVDDIPLILQDENIGANGQLLIGGGGGGGGRGGGRGGNNAQTLVNGAINPTLTTDQAQLRFRILNASDQSFYTIGFSDNREFYQVASDGGFLPTAAPLTQVAVAPAERVELVVNVTGTGDFSLLNSGNGGRNKRQYAADESIRRQRAGRDAPGTVEHYRAVIGVKRGSHP